MSEAATFGSRTTAAGPPSAGTSTLNAIAALFSATFARQMGSKRILLLAALYALPIALAVLMQKIGANNRGPTEGYDPMVAEYWLIYTLIPQAFVPLTALVFASGMIQDEIEDQTITYLLIRPLPRWSIYAAKLLATLLATILLTALFAVPTFVAIGWGQSGYWGEPGGGLARMLRTIALFALSLTAYGALFGLLGLLMRRSVLLGIGYIILLEGWLATIDFVIRKGTVMYYFRVLCERWLAFGHAEEYHIDLSTAPGSGESVATLLGASAAAALLGCFLMRSREFRVKTPEGS